MSTQATDADDVFAAARHVLDLQERLARLDEERASLDARRASLQAEIDTAMSKLAELAVEAVRPPAPHQPTPPPPPPPSLRYPPADPSTLGGLVLRHLNQNPTRAFSVADLVRELKITNRRSKTNLRALLSRMTKDGRVARAGYGHYRANPLP